MGPPKQQDLAPCPYLKANIISRVFFWWMNGFFGKGRKRPIEAADLYQALPSDRSKTLGDEMQKLWEEEVEHCEGTKYRPSLRKVITKQFGKSLLLVGFLAFFEECVIRIGQPLCLGYLIVYFAEHHSTKYEYEGWLLASGIILCSVCYTFTHHSYFFGVQHIGMQIRVASSTLIYRKALKLSQSALGDTTIGQMANLLSNDLSRFDQSTIHLHYLWIGPVQTVIVTAILWYFFFGVTCLVGVSVMILFVPFQGFMGKMFSKQRTSTAEKTDKRIHIMTEIVGGMKIIKMYGWETPYSQLVSEARKDEIRIIRKTNWYRAINTSLFYVASKVMVFLTLLTHVLVRDPPDNRLTAQMVFVTLTLYHNVRLVMTQFFPNAVSSLAETLVSIKRIEDFLLMEERVSIPNPSKPRASSHSGFSVGSVILDQFCASWTNKEEQETLKDISLVIKRQDLIAIVGVVGSGKTSLLQAILQELPATSGKIKVNGTLAYTCQEPWVFAGSVRQNILFGKKFNQERYNKVVEACALKRDLELLPHGDRTLVGDKGSSLSGGQKARLTLARAVYADADIYLLDDPLSAVDAEVGQHLFKECICGTLKDKTRILVTHQIQLLTTVKTIVLLDEGRIKAVGGHEKISTWSVNGVQLAESLIQIKTLASQLKKERKGSASSMGSFDGGGGQERGSIYSIDHAEFNDSEDDDDDYEGGAGDGEEGDAMLNQTKNSRPKATEEGMETGGIGSKLYIQYFKAGSNCCTIFLLIFFDLVAHVTYTGIDWWLSFWTKAQGEPPPRNEWRFLYNRDNQIYMYSGIMGVLFISSFIRTIAFFGICMAASVNLHESMFFGILRSPMRFFETNPVGRILNRISKDIGVLDEVLPPTLFDTLEIFLNALGIVVIVAIVNPILLCPAAVLSIVLYCLRRFYLKTAREIKRIEGVARSPVLSHLSTSLYGLTTIRAFKAEAKFIQKFDDYQDTHTSSWYLFLASSRWLGVWLDWISLTFLAFTTYSFMFTASDDGANVGLAISSAMMLTGMFQWGVRQSAEMENQMVSVERVIEYTKLEPEAALDSSPGKKPPANWPQKGEIVFDHVSLSYGDEKPVLKDITCTIKPSEKIGIVGRTGAGKSSLLTALFRIAEPQGSIVIDGINVLQIGLHDLRAKISIIPQDPVLFTGSLRRNLDPFDNYKDANLWSVVENVHLFSHPDHPIGALDTEVSEGGGNFSVGQRQLVCLARAILKNNKILVLDEATANVDNETDNLIQKTIRTKFAQCTVLTIAHRLHTVMDSDRIMVLDAGAISEFDNPYTLLQNPKTSLYSLAEQSGALNDLLKIAKEAAIKKGRIITEAPPASPPPTANVSDGTKK